MRTAAFNSLFSVSLIFATASWAQASILFDDFNTNEGHFTGGPANGQSGGSGTSSVTTASTADRTTTAGEVFGGAGSEKLVLVGAAATSRSRLLSGAGAPANNSSFSITAGTDGKIGFIYKVVGAANGLQLSVNLDDSTNTAANSIGGILKNANADGNWHVVEWDLDVSGDWGGATGIGGSNANWGNTALNPRTIDSVGFYNLAATTTTTVIFDSVLKSDSGSIQALVAPAKATNTSPLNGSLTADVNDDLTWGAGNEYSKQFNVFFDTNPTPSTQVVTNGTGTTFDPGALLANTTYYWRVDSKNLLGDSVAGDVWSFTTTPEPATLMLLALGCVPMMRRGRRA